MAHAANAAPLLRLLLAASLVLPSLAVPSPQRRPSAPSRWRMLGASCDADRDCAVPYSRCVAGACACQAYYARYNESRCLPSTLLGFECMVREQCSLKVANSSCIHGLCRCEPGFLQFRRHTCLSPAKPGDVCYSDAHCRLWDGNSHCHFLIPKLFGRCGCNAHMVPRGSVCVRTQEDDFPPLLPSPAATADPSTRHPPVSTTTTTTTAAPTTTSSSAPTTLSQTTTPSTAVYTTEESTSAQPTTEGITTPSTPTSTSTTPSPETTSTSSALEDGTPSSELTESVAVPFSTSESAPQTDQESDVSIKYPVPSSYPTPATEDPYREVTDEMEAETFPLMADDASPPASSTQSAEPEALSSSPSSFGTTENILGSSEVTVSTPSQSAGEESDTVPSPTSESTSPDAPIYSFPEALSPTPKPDTHYDESADISSPTSTEVIDNQVSDSTAASASLPSHPPQFSVGTELTFDANYATSTENQPSISIEDSWSSSSAAYSEPVVMTTEDTAFSVDDIWISSSTSSDPIVTTSQGADAATNDVEAASPSAEVVTPTQETPGTSSLEPLLQDDTEDVSVTERVQPPELSDDQSSAQAVPVSPGSAAPPSSPSAPLVVTEVTAAEKPSTEDDLMLAATSFSAGMRPLAAVSLGLPCVSDLQCRAADPHSRCLGGSCDCARRPNGTGSCWAGNRGCHPATFQCRSTGACISWFFVCDGRRDCADGSDELCNEAEGGGCPALAFRCGSGGSCVSRAARCDGNRDCPLGEDEQGCDQRKGCPAFTFACSGAGAASCLPDYELCNAVVSCPDGSDEPQWCRVPPPTTPAARRLRPRTRPRTGPRCPFRCDNGRCRSTAILCSGRDGCGDASDEAQCRVCKCAPASD